MTADWIAADWGSSGLRLWAMGADGTVLAEARAPGAGITPEALREAITPWMGAGAVDIVACGPGWGADALNPVPCALDQAAQPVGFGADLRLHVVQGLSQASPPDLMQGGETVIAGVLAQHPSFDGIICLPGAKTHWAHISAEEVVSFASSLSATLLSSLTDARHTPDPAAFTAAMEETLSRPERLAQGLSSAKAAEALGNLSESETSGQLWGLLIGAELAAMRPYWLGQEVLILGDPELARLYAQALDRQGAQTRLQDRTDALLRGLTRAFGRLPGRVD